MVTRNELVGAWRLERWEYVYEDGRPNEYPLGADAVGYLMYTPDGHVSASLARASHRPVSGRAIDKADAYDAFFGYAGRFELRDAGTVIHRIDIASNPAVAGVDSVRHAVLDADRLVLSGPDFRPDGQAPRTHRIVWRRA